MPNLRSVFFRSAMAWIVFLAPAQQVGLSCAVPKAVGTQATRPSAAWTSAWASSFGGAAFDFSNDVLPLADGGVVTVGYSSSVGQGTDAWAMQLDRSGHPVWQKSYGGPAWDEWRDVALVPSGGYVAVGMTKSYGAGDNDLWVARLDAAGDLLWQRAIGGAASDTGTVVIPAASGFYVVGTTSSATAGQAKVWILKLDDTGAVSWQKVYGTSDGAADAVLAADGSLWVVVLSGTSGGFLSTVLMRLDAAGTIQWQRAYVGDHNSIFTPRSLALTTDGGAVIAGYAGAYPSNLYDAWAIKVDASGAIQWQVTVGGAGDDQANEIVPFGTAGYRLVGYTNSASSANQELWVLGLDQTGAVVQQVALGGSGTENANAAALSSDYRLVVGGYTNSFGAGSNDAWILKLDPYGQPGTACDLASTTTVVGVQGVATAQVSALAAESTSLGSSASSSAVTPITLTAARQCQGPELEPVLFVPALLR